MVLAVLEGKDCRIMDFLDMRIAGLRKW